MGRTANGAISYVLRDPKGKVPTPIIGIIRFNNDRLKIATGFKVRPAHWNDERGRVKNVLEAKDKNLINTFLEGLEKEAENILTDLRSKRIALTKDILRSRIADYLTPVVAELPLEEPALYTFISDFIARSPDRVNPDTGKHVEHRTIQKYQTVLKVLREFGLIYKRPVDFDTIDLEFYDAFTAYLTSTKGFATNNVGKYVQTLKVFLNEASAKGINVKQDYRSRRFKVVKEDSESVYLNEAELSQLGSLSLTSNPRLERVRDLFLVGCYTGLRFSDLTNLRPEFVKNGLIRMEQFKTSDKVVIPCHPVVTAMLDKYQGHLPRSISNQKMNDYLKELCQLAGLTTLESKGMTKGGVRQVLSFEKWQLVSTHTARRSFATNMYLLGVPTLTIMKITGHRTEKAFMRYIKLDEEQHAKIIAQHWQKQLLVNQTATAN